MQTKLSNLIALFIHEEQECDEFTHRYITAPPTQRRADISIYITNELSAEYCDEPGMKLLGTLTIDLPDVHPELNRIIEFSLIFWKNGTCC